MIGERTAEEIKIEIGSAIPAENGEEEIKEIRGGILSPDSPKSWRLILVKSGRLCRNL